MVKITDLIEEDMIFDIHINTQFNQSKLIARITGAFILACKDDEVRGKAILAEIIRGLDEYKMVNQIGK